MAKSDAPNYYSIIKGAGTGVQNGSSHAFSAYGLGGFLTSLLPHPVEPMDLGKMQRKLRNGEYTSKGAFVRDIELILKNCRKYNDEVHCWWLESELAALPLLLCGAVRCATRPRDGQHRSGRRFLWPG